MPAFTLDPFWARAFWLVYAAWAVQEVVILRRDRRRVAGRREDRGSLPIFVLAMVAAVAAAFTLTRVRGAGMGARPASVEPAALALMVGGMGLRVWAVRTLGVFFRVAVVAQAGHRLVEAGPYRWLRHPAYTGALLTVTGVALAMGNWLSLLVAPAVAGLGFARRIAVEERSLAGLFGEAFADYRARRWALLPPIW